VLLDSIFSVVFILAIIINVTLAEFSTVNDKVIECLIGLALPVAASFYSFLDGLRFLPENGALVDKVLYLISCVIL
jgi:hypothetical protein